MRIPDFKTKGTSEEIFRLKDYKGKKVVLFFYPKDSTRGCTIEGQDFSRLNVQFKKAGAVVFGVSRDSLKSHENFKIKCKIAIELLSDPDEELCRIFDVIKEKNMYGRKVMGIERSTFLIDEKGKVAFEWRKVKVPGHAEEVLEKVKSL